jgi:myo-inositol 2-dehydrogenase / D-chiro-inositol 1-dehydrogenase
MVLKLIKQTLRKDAGHLSRRNFLAGVGAIAYPFTVMKPELARGSRANSKLALGLIGCGVRGTWLAELLHKHGGYQVTAAMDYFPSQVNAFGQKLSVPTSRRFSGLSGYRQMFESKVDAVAIESPPYFHPEQAAAAVDAGVHVFLAKPMAVDVPGCRSIEASGKKATEKKLAFLIDFQTRTDPYYQEALRRVHKGDIGRVISGEATYITGAPFERQVEDLKVNPQDPERRLRAWGLSLALSGDVITEQNIHAIDAMTWALDQHPASACGTCGLKSRNLGDCHDHFSVIFRFREDAIVTFCSKQYGTGWEDILCRMYATEGTLDTHYAGDVSIRGRVPYAGGRDGSLYEAGAVRNIATFYDNIIHGRWENSTVSPSVRSNLTTILGRMAAYKRAEVTWDEMLRSEERLDPHLSGLIG